MTAAASSDEEHDSPDLTQQRLQDPAVHKRTAPDLALARRNALANAAAEFSSSSRHTLPALVIVHRMLRQPQVDIEQQVVHARRLKVLDERSVATNWRFAVGDQRNVRTKTSRTRTTR